MIAGYQLTGYDNDSYMTGSCDHLFPELTGVPRCKQCSYRTDYRYTNKDFILNRKTLDFSSTYDGVTIVSLKFKEFCHRNGYTNLEFAALPKAPGFYQFYVQGNCLAYTARLQENRCVVCGQYESVVGPAMKLDDLAAPLADGFYQSDLWFGSRNAKAPVTIIAPLTKEKLAKEKIRNLCLVKIEKPTATRKGGKDAARGR